VGHPCEFLPETEWRDTDEVDDILTGTSTCARPRTLKYSRESSGFFTMERSSCSRRNLTYS
jgi:hypothetical protein